MGKSISSRDIDDQRILQCDWMKGYFGLLTKTPFIMLRKIFFVLLKILHYELFLT